MGDQGPRPVLKIQHVKSSRVEPRVSRATGELARMVTSRMRLNISQGVLQPPQCKAQRAVSMNLPNPCYHGNWSRAILQ